ncbi:MAG: hypothetical protein AAF974_05740 [Cyanobacteria bacterium P01_E01_bin.34]
MSEDVTVRLQDIIASLPTPQPYSETIRNALLEAIARWQQQPEQNNALVVLCSPIEPLGQYIEQTLSSWHLLDERSLRILRWKAIPANPDAFVTKLRTEIGTQLKVSPQVSQSDAINEPFQIESYSLLTDSQGSEKNDEELQQLGIVLPELDQYFVRCIEGMEGVLYLRKEVQKDPHRFWVIGCNYWAWEYLSIVSKMDAYFDRTVSLPSLSGQELRDWLTPARQYLRSSLPDVESPQPSADATYFDTLVRVAGGLSSVAAQLWVSSLRLVKPSEAATNSTRLIGAGLAGASLAGAPLSGATLTGTTSVPSKASQPTINDPTLSESGNNAALLQLELLHPTSPKPINLSAGDRYLLYSLLLHNGLQFWHLALSLGETESLVQARVKGLQRQGIIEQRGRNWYVRPEYYPSLRSTLAGNNFLVAKDG